MLIAFFNDYVDESKLIQEFKFGSKILNRTPCFSYDIILRKTCHEIIAFSKTDYYVKSTDDICYGMLYDIELNKDDEFIINMLFNAYCYKSNIKVSTLNVQTYMDFVQNNVIVTKYDVNCICYVAKKCTTNDNIFSNRHIKINFNSKLLLNFIKI